MRGALLGGASKKRSASLQSLEGLLGGDAAALEAAFEVGAKFGIVLQQPVDEVVVLLQRGQLERGDSLDRDDDGFAVAQTAVIALAGLGLTQGNHFHGAR